MDDDKELAWVGTSRKELQAFPEDVKDDIGYALRQVQKGEKPPSAKPLKGIILGATILEIIANDRSGTYRAVYTVKFDDIVYVLHCFQKKSHHGIETPEININKIVKRFKEAEDHYKANYE